MCGMRQMLEHEAQDVEPVSEKPLCGNTGGGSAVDNDCEDQGFTRISDGYMKSECISFEPDARRPPRPRLGKIERAPSAFGVCGR